MYCTTTCYNNRWCTDALHAVLAVLPRILRWGKPICCMYCELDLFLLYTIYHLTLYSRKVAVVRLGLLHDALLLRRIRVTKYSVLLRIKSDPCTVKKPKEWTSGFQTHTTEVRDHIYLTVMYSSSCLRERVSSKLIETELNITPQLFLA